MSDKDLQDFAAAQAKTAPNGAALSQSMSYGVQQNPDEYARALRLAKKVGISPQIVNPEVHQAVDTSEAIGAVSQSPNVASWFSNHDNASVAHDDIHALTAIEQAAQQGISVGTATADPRSALRREYLDPALRTAQSFPPTRFAIGAAGGTVGMLGNIASFFGIHGDNGGPNAFQRVQQELDPSVTGAATVMEGRHLPFDTISQNVGPLLPAAGIGFGTSAATRALGLSERAQALIGGGNVGAAFTADQGGAAYQQAIQSGKTPQEARQIANRVALINAPANVGLSALSALPSIQKYGAASAIGLGAGMGFSGQVGQNYVEGKPLTEGGLGATVRGAATQLGLHAAFAGATPIDHDALAVEQNQAFFQAIADPAQASKLAKRYGPAFEDAVAAATKDGPVQTVQIAPDKLMQYFQDNKIDPVAGAEDLGIKNFPESLVAGTDAVIPIVKFTSKIAADPKAFEALRGDLRLYDGEATASDLKTQETPTEPSAATQEEAAQTDAESKNPELMNIQADMQARLLAAGRSPGEAEAGAKVWTAQINALSQRGTGEGWSPQELHDFYAPTITTPGLEERAGEPLASRAVDRLAAQQEAGSAAPQGNAGEPPIFGQGPVDDKRGTTPEANHFRDLIGKMKAGTITDAESHELNFLFHEDRLNAKVKGRNIPEVKNAVAYAEAKDAKELKPVQLFSDADGFKKINDTLGHDAGDHAIRAMGEILAKHFGEGNVFHRGGDEFLMQADTHEEAASKMEAARAELAQIRMEGIDQKTGEHRVQTGVGLSYGKGATDAEAERNQYADKKARALAGLREERRAELPDSAASQHGADAGSVEQGRVQANEGLAVGQGRESAVGFEQGSKPLEFGSKEWNAYYKENKGSLTPKGEPAGGSGGKERARQFKTKKGQEAFDNAMADSALAEKRAYEEYRRQFAAFDKSVKEIQAGDIYSKGTRGFVQFDADGKPQIGFMNADPSTFFHETGHITLEMLGNLASKEGASEGLKSDYQGILDWLGAKDRESISVDQHEKFARGIEQYLREGKAPSEALRPVFQRIKYWFMGVYRHARELNVQLNPEIRAIMDRLYASEEEINQARKSMGDDGGLFTTAKDMGVSEETFKLYKNALRDYPATAKDKMVMEHAKEDNRQKEAWWKEELAKTKERVAAQVDADPGYKAFKALSKGETEDGAPIKLDKSDLVSRYGNKVLDELPKAFGHIYRNEGVDADTAADALGFRSADELINTLRDLEPRKARIDRLADLEMKAKHGDLLNDGSGQDKALEALHGEKRAQVLEMEMKALDAKRREVEPFVKQALKEAKPQRVEVPKLDEFKAAAKNLIEGTAIKDLDPHRYLIAERTKSREAFEAVQKNKPEEALDAKRKELLNHFLYREAVKARDEAQSIQTYAKRVSGDKYRAKLGLAGERAGTDFLSQHDNILDRFDFRRITNKEIAKKQQSLSEWAAKMTAEGESPALTDEILNENYRKNYREMTVPELQAVRDALVNIGHLANEVNKVTIEGKKIDREQVISSMVKALQDNEGHEHAIPFDPNLKKSVGEKAGHLGRGVDALLIRMEQMFKWADNGDVNGIFHQAIWNPIQKAHEDMGDMSREITAKVQKAMDTMPREMRKKMLDTIDVEGMPSGTMTRKGVLTMLLNMGNDSNFEKLTRGYGISPDAVFKAVGKLSKEEVEWAQHIWDTVGSLRPKIGELERRTTGLEPKWVEARPFSVHLQNGEEVKLNGGYFPVKYDPRLSTVGERQLTGDVSELTDKGFSRPSTPNGFTKERTRFTGPLMLDYEQVLLPHLSAVLKDLSHREAVKQAYQLISDNGLRKAFTEAFGKEYTDQLLPWLKTIVNDSNGASIKGLGLLDSGMRGIRRNTVAAAMGFRVSTALVQYTGITRSLHEVGTLNFAKAYSEFISSPKKSFDWINEVSGEMRNRAQNLDRDFREAHNRAVAGDIHGLRSNAAELAFYGLHLTDIAISYPTWLGKFRQALGQGKDQATAIKEADQAVRLTQPTAAPKDLPAIMRNNETAKLITMFYGHFNLLYQNLRDTGHFISDSKNHASDRAMRAAKTALVSLILPALGEGLFRNPPGEDENYAEWLLLKSLHFGSASVPLIRELGKGIVDSLEGKKVDMKFSPMLETLAKGGKAIQDTHKAAIGEGDTTRAIMSDLDAAGYITGVPGTGQAMTTARYIQGRMSGKIPEEGFLDTIHHAAVGYPQGGKK